MYFSVGGFTVQSIKTSVNMLHRSGYLLGLIVKSTPSTYSPELIYCYRHISGRIQRFRGFRDNPQGKHHPYIPVSNNQENIIKIGWDGTFSFQKLSDKDPCIHHRKL